MVGPIVVGSTYKWSPTFLKDGAIFDLTGASITVNFLSPIGTVYSFALSIIDALAGTASYVNQPNLFTTDGMQGIDGLMEAQWYRSYRITFGGGGILESKPIPFMVYQSIAGS